MNPIKEEYLISLRADFNTVGSYLLDISKAVLKQQITMYPIFIVHNEPALSLGKLIIDSGRSKTNWCFSASVIEELLRKDIVTYEKLDEFKMVYKDPLQYACVLMITKEMQDFVFIPYNQDAMEEADEDEGLEEDLEIDDLDEDDRY